MNSNLIFVRTDRNGTKIYHDYTCPRCGGAGESDKWHMTGKTCYACGGTGKRVKPIIVKEYTPEYEAKLEAKRLAKVENEKHSENEEQKTETDNARQMILEQRYAELGCGKNGIGYVLQGKTFKVKDEIKKNGGKWIYDCWVCPIEIKKPGITVKKIDLNGHVGSGSKMWLDDFDMYEAING